MLWDNRFWIGQDESQALLDRQLLEQQQEDYFQHYNDYVNLFSSNSAPPPRTGLGGHQRQSEQSEVEEDTFFVRAIKREELDLAAHLVDGRVRSWCAVDYCCVVDGDNVVTTRQLAVGVPY